MFHQARNWSAQEVAHQPEACHGHVIWAMGVSEERYESFSGATVDQPAPPTQAHRPRPNGAPSAWTRLFLTTIGQGLDSTA